ncbi:MAG: NAD(P)H-binding protein [Anaerolineales bacterium]|nr:NAD(P)H-binding protein [Anaerolineales bacterium]
MILVTGGTGFIGKALIRHLVEMGYPVRTLIRPSPRSPNLPRRVAVDVAVSSLSDERGLRAAMVGADAIYHLVGGEWSGPRASLLEIDIKGTRAVVEAAADAGVERIFYVSHLGADRASAYPVLKAKAIAEEFVRRSGLTYTILRSAVVYGPNDSLTSGLARIMSALPFMFLLPGSGEVQLQPLWVEDLVACLTWCLDEPETYNRTIDIGGPEYLSFRQIVELVMQETGIRRSLVNFPPPYLRGLTMLLESLLPNLPVSVYWLDYLAVNRTSALDTMPRVFNLMPARMSQRLAYLHGGNWRSSLFRTLLGRNA